MQRNAVGRQRLDCLGGGMEKNPIRAMADEEAVDAVRVSAVRRDNKHSRVSEYA